ncbi:asparaginase [Castellaniella denitrificans]|jgi:L-asparaginase|uniref:asparaginase n=1 Tax=Castellaniella denitrificans TaxID=56119 RepID=UPI001AC86522|nr:asparaginase [Burkholderiales bacterium]
MRPRLVLIGTGGTIAATAGDARTLTGYRVTQGIEAMLAAIPGAADVADIRCEQPFNVDSRDLGTARVLRLARAVERHTRDADVDAVVVTHGTDSLEETAFFLHLTVRSPKPVVLVGAMRPASALSADGPLNLVNALLTAADPASRDRGVLVVMNDRIVAARHAAKRHTTRVDAFGADGEGVLGAVTDGRVRYALRPDLPDAAEFSLAGLRALPPVDIILDYQDAPPHPYAAAIRAGSRGIVVASMGNGSLSPAAARGCAQAIRRGLVCVRASRVPDGLVTDSGAGGPLAAHALNPLQARIALRLALARGMDRAEIGDLLRRL